MHSLGILVGIAVVRSRATRYTIATHVVAGVGVTYYRGSGTKRLFNQLLYLGTLCAHYIIFTLNWGWLMGHLLLYFFLNLLIYSSYEVRTKEIKKERRRRKNKKRKNTNKRKEESEKRYITRFQYFRYIIVIRMKKRLINAHYNLVRHISASITHVILYLYSRNTMSILNHLLYTPAYNVVRRLIAFHECVVQYIISGKAITHFLCGLIITVRGIRGGIYIIITPLQLMKYAMYTLSLLLTRTYYTATPGCATRPVFCYALNTSGDGIETFSGDKLTKAWVLDDGATVHICTSPDMFLPGTTRQCHEWVKGYNGVPIKGQSRGTILLRSTPVELESECVQKEESTVRLENVICIPSSQHNLISRGLLDKAGHTTYGKSGSLYMLNPEGSISVSGKLLSPDFGPDDVRRDLYAVQMTGTGPSPHVNTVKIATQDDFNLLHEARGHQSEEYLRKQENVEIPSHIHLRKCEACIQAKLTDRRHKNSKRVPPAEFLDELHGDLCGPWPVESLAEKKKYFSVLIDVKTRYTWIAFHRNKSDYYDYLKKMLVFFDTQFGKTPKVLHFDGGGEFDNGDVQALCDEKGMILSMTARDSPSQNGLSERANRTIQEGAKAMLLQAGLPSQFWMEAMNTFVYIKNQSPHRGIDFGIPLKELHKVYPAFYIAELESHIQGFGCLVYAYEIPRKGASPGIPCLFLGPDRVNMGARLFDLTKQKIIKRKVIKALPGRYPGKKVIVGADLWPKGDEMEEDHQNGDPVSESFSIPSILVGGEAITQETKNPENTNMTPNTENTNMTPNTANTNMTPNTTDFKS
jgi:transposase InsO family protein